MVFDFITIVPHLLSCCSFLSLDIGYPFGRFQHLFVDGCSAVSCDLGVSVRRGEVTSFYSAILSPPVGCSFPYVHLSVFVAISFPEQLLQFSSNSPYQACPWNVMTDWQMCCPQGLWAGGWASRVEAFLKWASRESYPLEHLRGFHTCSSCLSLLNNSAISGPCPTVLSGPIHILGGPHGWFFTKSLRANTITSSSVCNLGDTGLAVLQLLGRYPIIHFSPADLEFVFLLGKPAYSYLIVTIEHPLCARSYTRKRGYNNE